MALAPLDRFGSGTASDPCDYGEGSIQSCDGTLLGDLDYETAALTTMASTIDGLPAQKSPLLVVAVHVVGQNPPIAVYDCTSGSCGGGPPSGSNPMSALRVRKTFGLDPLAAQGPALAFLPSASILPALQARLATLESMPPLLLFHVYKVAAPIRGVEAGGYIAIPIAGPL